MVSDVSAGRMIDVERDQFELVVGVQIRHGDAAALGLGAEPAGDANGVGPGSDLAVDVDVPANAIVGVVPATGVVNVIDDQVGPTDLLEVGGGDARSLGHRPEPARDRYRVGPAASDDSRGIQFAPDAEEAIISSPGAVDVEDDEVELTVVADVGDGDAPAMVLRAEPARNQSRRRPPAVDTSKSIEIPADAVEAAIAAARDCRCGRR